jgi:LysM repeat protein
MKPTLLFAALSLVFASSSAFGKSEAAKASAPTTSTYTVKAGDSFDKIARKTGTSAETLAKSNGLKTSSVIHPGLKLKVPGATKAAATQTVAAASPQAAKSNGKTHTVQQGETFSSISKKHGISTGALVAANPKVKPSALRPGQVVSLGGSSSSTTMIAASKTPVAVEKTPAPAPAVAQKSPAAHQNVPMSTPPPASKPAPTPAAAPENKQVSAAAQEPAAEKEKQTLSPTTEKKIHAVTIDGEITYGEFASKHGTDAERLNALNGLDLTTATVLAKGSELYVPAQP